MSGPGPVSHLMPIPGPPTHPPPSVVSEAVWPEKQTTIACLPGCSFIPMGWLARGKNLSRRLVRSPLRHRVVDVLSFMPLPPSTHTEYTCLPAFCR